MLLRCVELSLVSGHHTHVVIDEGHTLYIAHFLAQGEAALKVGHGLVPLAAQEGQDAQVGQG